MSKSSFDRPTNSTSPLIPLSESPKRSQPRTATTRNASRHATSYLLPRRSKLDEEILSDPYNPLLHLELALTYASLNYPDLAAYSSYISLLLCDEITDCSGEYHELAYESATKAFHPFEGDDVAYWTLDSSPQFSDFTQDGAARVEQWIERSIKPQALLCVARSLVDLNCLRTSLSYLVRFEQVYPKCQSNVIQQIRLNITEKAQKYLKRKEASEFHDGEQIDLKYLDTRRQLPDEGRARRDVYPWNTHEEDRISPTALEQLNLMIAEVAPKLEVRTIDLPVLSHEGSDQSGEDEGRIAQTKTVKQLGVFACEDLAPGEVILCERSILTAQARGDDSLCDACTAKIPPFRLSKTSTPQVELHTTSTTTSISCPHCTDTLFCSPTCHTLALRNYHTSPLCSADDKTGAAHLCRADVAPQEASDELYTRLLFRALSLARVRGVHPLDLKEVRWIWGDFNVLEDEDHAENSIDEEGEQRWLPWSFKRNVLQPIRFLEALDLDIYTGGLSPLANAKVKNDEETGNEDAGENALSENNRITTNDLTHSYSSQAQRSATNPSLTYSWTHTTLLAKFRATASARFPSPSPPSSTSSSKSQATRKPHNSSSAQSPNTTDHPEPLAIRPSRPQGPEAAAVFPLWCLANHSCAPNVAWSWRDGGWIELRVRSESEYAVWRRTGTDVRKEPGLEAGRGVKKGDQILNHYVDVDIADVHKRREWAAGPLGGLCLCERCVWESGED